MLRETRMHNSNPTMPDSQDVKWINSRYQSVNTNREQHGALTQQPQRDAVHQRTHNNTYPLSRYCGTAPQTQHLKQLRPKTHILHHQ
jgi:hypothetical protein